MHHDHFRSWVDYDRLLAAQLQQYPDWSSIELAKNLVAETDLSLRSAFDVVQDYLFRKAIDTSEADWKFVRSLWPQILQGVLGIVAAISLLRLMKFCLPSPMFAVILNVWAVLGIGIWAFLAVRNRSASPRRDDPGW